MVNQNQLSLFLTALRKKCNFYPDNLAFKNDWNTDFPTIKSSLISLDNTIQNSTPSLQTNGCGRIETADARTIAISTLENALLQNNRQLLASIMTENDIKDLAESYATSPFRKNESINRKYLEFLDDENKGGLEINSKDDISTLAKFKALIIFTLTFLAASPPPTDITKTKSFLFNLLIFNHDSNTVAQPSSFVRAVNSDTLSVGV